VSAPVTPREHALRVAALEALVEAAKKEYAAARAEAEEAFKKVRADGQPQQRVLLPDGEDVGLISIKDGGYSVDMPEERLLAWCREHNPGAVEEYVDPSAWFSADVIAVVKDKFPGLIRERVRPGTVDELVAQVIDTKGYLTADGEKFKVAEVTRNLPNGSFQFAGGAGASRYRRDRIMTELLRGNQALRELIGFGPLALPPMGEETQDAA
jgi:hypothetical protein